MAEVKKSDFIYFQNEFLQELKQIDIKFTEKIAQLVATFQNTQLITDQKFEIYNDKISSLITKIETKEEYKKLKTELDKFKEYTNQEIIANSNKIYYLERDLSDACFKYDNLFSSMGGSPGLIGKGCKYPNLKTFYEIIDKNIAELQNNKDKNIINLDKYKNKLETLIGQFRLQIDGSQNRYFSFCNEKILETKNKIDDQFNMIEEKISKMRMDNGKHSFELIRKSEELKNKISILDNITEEVDNKLKEEMKKYIKYNNEIIKNFELQKEEFKIIKIRFTELSEFIKDIRFMKNVTKNFNNSKENPNSKEFDSTNFLKKAKNLSKKLNFKKNQQITEEEENYINKFKIFKNLINNSIKEINKNNAAGDNNNIIKDNNDNIKENIVKGFEIDEEDKNNLNNNNNKNNDSNINTIINPSTDNNTLDNNTNKKNNKYNSPKSQNKSRNYNIYNNKEIKTENISNKKFDYLKTEESSTHSIILSQKKKSNLFIRTQSQFSLSNKDYKKNQRTQDNFYNKKKILNIEKMENNFSLGQNESTKTIIFKNIFEKKETFDFNELLKVLEKENINNNNLQVKAFNYLNDKIRNIEDKNNDINNINKINFVKIHKKLQFYIDLTKKLFMKIKIDKLKKDKKEYNSPIQIYTTSDFQIPLLNTFDKKNLINKDIKDSKDNKDLTERNKIKIKNDNLTLLNIKEKHQKISSGKILSVIEPYLIKKFKSN